jgi:hypothetical protein
MAGARARISRATVAALQRGAWITDNTLPGFKVRRPNRLALYGLNIRLQGRMRWISLGTEADLTPDQAQRPILGEERTQRPARTISVSAAKARHLLPSPGPR